MQRDAARAEYVIVAETNAWSQHENISSELGAIFDPLGNAVHTALKFPVVDEDVLFTGAWSIDLMAGAGVRDVGARFTGITDASAPRLQLAQASGVDLAISVAETKTNSVQRSRAWRRISTSAWK